MQRIATLLERHKSRNFNYLNFSTTPNPIIIPIGATGTAIKYEITVWDGANPTNTLTNAAADGQSWVIQALTKDPQNLSFLMSSRGLKCQSLGVVIAKDCVGAQPWK